MEAPKRSLVENYMIEIARNYKVDYEPDPSMFLVNVPFLREKNFYYKSASGGVGGLCGCLVFRS